MATSECDDPHDYCPAGVSWLRLAMLYVFEIERRAQIGRGLEPVPGKPGLLRFARRPPFTVNL